MGRRIALAFLILGFGLAAGARAEGPAQASATLGRELGLRLADRIEARAGAALARSAALPVERALALEAAWAASHMHCEELHASLARCTIRLGLPRRG